MFIGLSGDEPCLPSARISLAKLDEIVVGRGTTRATAYEGRRLVLSLPDSRMSSRHSLITNTGGGRWALKDLGSKNGTWIGHQRVEKPHALADGDVTIVGHTALIFRETGGELEDAFELPPTADPGLLTLNAEATSQFSSLVKAAQTDVAIELAGASGTGKELAARAVHAVSQRLGRFVAFNCGSCSPSMIESELFGHTSGAFTGAVNARIGLIRSADRGTIFLDEIAELPPAAQTTLLRVLQEREIRPLGSDRVERVDLRLITATLKNLDAEVAAHRFRPDLRARLLGIRVCIPTLRERIEDLGWLTAMFLKQASAGRDLTFTADAVTALYTYSWPLNIRELQHAIKAACALARDRIEPSHLPEPVRRSLAARPSAPEQLSPSDVEHRNALVRTLERFDWNVSATARELGKDPKQVRRWIRRFKIVR